MDNRLMNEENGLERIMKEKRKTENYKQVEGKCMDCVAWTSTDLCGRLQTCKVGYKWVKVTNKSSSRGCQRK